LCNRVLGRARISHSLSGSRSGSFGLRSGCLEATWKAPRDSRGALACVSLLVSVEWCSGGSRQERQERVSCWQEEEWDGPTSALSHHHQRVITGAETAADGGIARCLPETFGQTVPRSPRWWLGRDLRDARWQGMGGWVPACWVRRVGPGRSCHFHQTHAGYGVGGMTQTVRHGSSLDYVV